MIEFLPWDTDFFGLKIGRASVAGSVADLAEQAKQDAYQLLYVFTEHDACDEKRKDLIRCGAKLYDRRVMYAQNTQPEWGDVTSVPEVVSGLGCQAHQVLYDLAVACGHHSRFYLDSRLPNHLFEKMYHVWIEKSLSGDMAVEVLLCQFDSQIQGLCTLRDQGDRLDIGLIGVSEHTRGRGIGRLLTQAAMHYAHKHQYPTLQVATQVDNVGACAFYERLGFDVDHRVDVYHLWL